MSDPTPATPVWSVPVPEGAEPPYEVFVNGVPLREGDDYRVEGRWIRVSRALRTARPRDRLGLGGRILLTIGIGVYRDEVDSVDLRYRAGGQVRHAADLPVIPPPDAPSR